MIWKLILGAYAVASTLAFALYGFDKSRARRGGRRVPEATLHTVELLGGWPGALLGSRVFRHKTQKTSFRVVLWAVVLLHVAAWAAWVWWKTRGAST